MMIIKKVFSIMDFWKTITIFLFVLAFLLFSMFFMVRDIQAATTVSTTPSSYGSVCRIQSPGAQESWSTIINASGTDTGIHDNCWTGQGIIAGYRTDSSGFHQNRYGVFTFDMSLPEGTVLVSSSLHIFGAHCTSCNNGVDFEDITSTITLYSPVSTSTINVNDYEFPRYTATPISDDFFVYPEQFSGDPGGLWATSSWNVFNLNSTSSLVNGFNSFSMRMSNQIYEISPPNPGSGRLVGFSYTSSSLPYIEYTYESVSTSASQITVLNPLLAATYYADYKWHEISVYYESFASGTLSVDVQPVGGDVE